ncbi:MAG: hypothetical protein GX989_06600 [Firmicutes bacterium]|nr:hypothetical protein [Bacillota bacterium]
MAGRMTMDGNLVGKVTFGSRRAVEFAERNLALHPRQKLPDGPLGRGGHHKPELSCRTL